MNRPTPESCGFVKTLNKMGYMTPYIDPYTEEFILFCKTIESPVLEIGTAYGVATLPLLKGGAHVTVNDLDPRHLNILYESIPLELRPNLNLKPGRFPTELKFEDNYFGGILVPRMLHLVHPSDLPLSIDLLFKWLKPNGKLFVIVDTPFLKFFEKFWPTYEKRVKNNECWPGFIENTQDFLSSRFEDVPEFVNFFDLKTLQNLFESHPFTLEKIGYIARPDFPIDLQVDGRESLGIILRKNA